MPVQKIMMLLFLGTLVLGQFSCMPYADPDEGLLYSCYDDFDCAEGGYTCSGLITEAELRPGDCQAEGKDEIWFINGQNGQCYYPYCRRDEDALRCGLGQCNEQQDCVALHDPMSSNGEEFYTACIKTEQAELASMFGDRCGVDADCGDGHRCVFDLKAWSRGDFGSVEADQEQAWRCFEGNVDLPAAH